MEPSDEVLVKWYEARDTFLGVNYHDRDVERGIKLALEVKDAIPEAKWLCNLFPAVQEAALYATVRDVLADLARDGNVTAQAYLSCMFNHGVVTVFHERPFHPLADGMELMATRSEYNEYGGHALEHRVEMAKKLAALREPRGFYELWHMDNNRTDYLKRAADLGLVAAWRSYGTYVYSFIQPERCYWWGKAAQYGLDIYSYLNHVAICLSHFLRGRFISECVVQINAMYGEGTLSHRHIEGISTKQHPHDQIARYIQDLCTEWKSDARRAVDAWLVIGRRLRVVRDIRKVIGKRIWDEWLKDVQYHPIDPDEDPIIVRARLDDPVIKCKFSPKF